MRAYAIVPFYLLTVVEMKQIKCLEPPTQDLSKSKYNLKVWYPNQQKAETISF